MAVSVGSSVLVSGWDSTRCAPPHPSWGHSSSWSSDATSRSSPWRSCPARTSCHLYPSRSPSLVVWPAPSFVFARRLAHPPRARTASVTFLIRCVGLILCRHVITGGVGWPLQSARFVGSLQHGCFQCSAGRRAANGVRLRAQMMSAKRVHSLPQPPGRLRLPSPPGTPGNALRHRCSSPDAAKVHLGTDMWLCLLDRDLPRVRRLFRRRHVK
jgi:hypothetical protein